jgi:hypothetical protein
MVSTPGARINLSLNGQRVTVTASVRTPFNKAILLKDVRPSIWRLYATRELLERTNQTTARSAKSA